MQESFLFDAPLVDIPPPLIKPRRKEPDPDKAAFEQLISSVLPSMPDDTSADEILDALAIHKFSRVGWHRARVLAVLMDPDADWQVYAVNQIAHKTTDSPTVWRYRRIASLTNCRGYEGRECTTLTRGTLCEACQALEQEDLWNHA